MTNSGMTGWIERQSQDLALTGIVRGPDGLGWVGTPRSLGPLAQAFLDCSPLDIPSLLLEQWPHDRGSPCILARSVPAFSALFSEIVETACVWPEQEEDDEREPCLVVGRRNPATGKPLFLLFEPGADWDAVQHLEREIGFALPEQLRAFYSTFGYLKAGDILAHEGLIGAMPGHAIGNVVAKREEWADWYCGLCEEVEVPAFEDHLPLYANGYGDYVVWRGRHAEGNACTVQFFSHDVHELYPCHRTVAAFHSDLITRVWLGADTYYSCDTL